MLYAETVAGRESIDPSSHKVCGPSVVAPEHQPVGIVPRHAVPVDADREPRVGHHFGTILSDLSSLEVLYPACHHEPKWNMHHAGTQLSGLVQPERQE